MKVDYYYDGQFRRSLLHIIRMFSEFQIFLGNDESGNPLYRKVPCRYMDFSRQAQILIAGASENNMNYAPMITISVQSLKMDRENARSPMQINTVMGTNQSPGINEYNDQLDEQYHVKRFNPVPWELVFDVNIWTTKLTHKMELWEQIATLFAPYTVIKTSMNPLDWTAEETVELIASSFTSKGVPAGTNEDIDIATLSFKTTVWFSLPANVQKAKIIEQINTNIGLARSEQEIEAGILSEIYADVFTPNNLQIRVNRISAANSTEEYEVQMLSSSGLTKGPNGGNLSWKAYLDYLQPGWQDRGIYLKFNHALEDESPIRANMISIGTGDDVGKIVVQVDTSVYDPKYHCKDFVIDPKIPRPDDGLMYIAGADITVNSIAIPANSIFQYTKDGISILPSSEYNGFVYVQEQNKYYSFSPSIGWYEAVLTNYKQGLWRIAFIN